MSYGLHCLFQESVFLFFFFFLYISGTESHRMAGSILANCDLLCGVHNDIGNLKIIGKAPFLAWAHQNDKF